MIAGKEVEFEKLCQWHLFHTLWSAAVGSPNYKKKAWSAMDRFIKKPAVCDCEKVYAEARK